jgi:hypothetical protein
MSLPPWLELIQWPTKTLLITSSFGNLFKEYPQENAQDTANRKDRHHYQKVSLLHLRGHQGGSQRIRGKGFVCQDCCRLGKDFGMIGTDPNGQSFQNME